MENIKFGADFTGCLTTLCEPRTLCAKCAMEVNEWHKIYFTNMTCVPADQSMKQYACAVSVSVVGTKWHRLSYNSVPLTGTP